MSLQSFKEHTESARIHGDCVRADEPGLGANMRMHRPAIAIINDSLLLEVG